MSVHCGKTIAEDMNAREMPVDNIRTARALQEHEALENDHQRAHVQPLADELGSQLEWRISDNSINLWNPKFHQEVDAVAAVRAAVVHQILCDHLMPGSA